MMAAYFAGEFWSELSFVMRSSVGSITDRLSVVHMVPAGASFDPRGPHLIAVSELPDPQLFLGCFFMASLTDQSVHASFKDGHYEFERRWAIPKPCGILGSYWSIFHPSIILCAASLWKSTGDSTWQENCSYYWESWVVGAVSDACQTNEQMVEQVIRTVRNEAILAHATLRPFSKSEPDLVTVNRLLGAFRSHGK